jgi:hypothetical protein
VERLVRAMQGFELMDDPQAHNEVIAIREALVKQIEAKKKDSAAKRNISAEDKEIEAGDDSEICNISDRNYVPKKEDVEL